MSANNGCVPTLHFFMLHLNVVLGSVLNVVFWQHCAYGLVRFRHKHHLISVGEKRSYFALETSALVTTNMMVSH